GETVVVGPRSNAAFLARLAGHPEFSGGHFDTGFIERHLADLTRLDPQAEAAIVGAAVEALLAPQGSRPTKAQWRDPWGAADGFSLGPQRQLELDILVDGHPRKATVAWHNGPHVTVDGVAAAQGVRVLPLSGGVVAIGRGVQRHVALKSYES